MLVGSLIVAVIVLCYAVWLCLDNGSGLWFVDGGLWLWFGLCFCCLLMFYLLYTVH